MFRFGLYSSRLSCLYPFLLLPPNAQANGCSVDPITVQLYHTSHRTHMPVLQGNRHEPSLMGKGTKLMALFDRINSVLRLRRKIDFTRSVDSSWCSSLCLRGVDVERSSTSSFPQKFPRESRYTAVGFLRFLVIDKCEMMCPSSSTSAFVLRISFIYPCKAFTPDWLVALIVGRMG